VFSVSSISSMLFSSLYAGMTNDNSICSIKQLLHRFSFGILENKQVEE
jgi:hypothetical protein